MLHDPKLSKTTVDKSKERATGRFQIRKLEERIAPAPGGSCGVNPHGKDVGKCSAPGRT
jgi:hypothetical protein